MQNLVDNAVKFSHEDSEPVEITLTQHRDRVVIVIADDGIGVPEGNLDALFEPFVKLDPARDHGRGYGVGLDLCRRIVHLHRGTITLAPRRPRGTEAVVTLPAT